MTEKRTFELGDKVGFKDDKEGIGIIVELETRIFWGGPGFLVKIIDAEGWHPCAFKSHAHKGWCISLDEEEMWLIG